ncbi:MAG: PAS domain S-box protein [Desulfococcaceae bacterium]
MSQKSILVVEDEAVVGADLANKLERLGHAVAATAAGAEEAISLARRLRPDLVLMDIRLGGTMDGIEAADAVREELDIPVVFLTAHSDPATLKRAKIAQPFGYILKPFEERELASQIEMALYKHLAERRVREQREWLRVTLLSIGDAVIATDADERITLINSVAEALTGRTAEEAEGRPLAEVFRVVDEPTGTPLEPPVSRALREGKPVPLENHAALVRRDGGTVPVEDMAAPILDAAGRTVGAVLVFHDVTAKRRAAEALRQSEEKFRTAFANAAIGFTMMRLDGRFVDANPAYQRLTGYSAEELAAQTFREMVHPDDLAENERWMDRLRTGAIDDFVLENRYRRKDGRVAWGRKSASLIRDAEGDPRWIIAFVEDISERKEAEAALRASEERYRSLAANLPNGAVFLVDRDLRYILAEGRALATMGLRPEDLEGRTVTEALDLPSAAAYEPAYRRTLDGEPERVENFSQGRHYVTHMTPLRNADGEVYAALAVSHDITRLKNAEQSLRAANQKLRTAYEELFDFSEAVSHDLDGAIRAASHYAGFLLADLADTLPDEQRGFLENLRQVTRNGRYLIAELRGLAKLGNRPEPPISIDFPEILREIMALYVVDPTVEIVHSETWPRLRAQPRLIRIILSNLIGNALKFNQSNPKRVEVGWQKDAPGRIELFVRDNGLGIAPRYHEHVFKIFKRMHTQKEYEGSGMGLAIIAKAARHLGGSVRLESELGKGSTFFVNLPESPGNPAPISDDPFWT